MTNEKQNPDCPRCAPGDGSETDELKAAYDNLVKAAEEYSKLTPKRPEPKGPPRIAPTLKHCEPSNFHSGYNMLLDAGGYMPGKIPVVVIPARPEDLRKYARYGSISARKLLAMLGLSLPKTKVSHE